MGDIKFSQAKELFYESLRLMFGAGVESEEDAVFAKHLIEYIMQTVDDCRTRGLEKKLLPIVYTSLWQGVEVDKKDFYSLRSAYLKTVVGTDSRNLPDLVIKLKKAMYEWGDESLGGTIKYDEDVTWELPDETE